MSLTHRSLRQEVHQCFRRKNLIRRVITCPRIHASPAFFTRGLHLHHLLLLAFKAVRCDIRRFTREHFQIAPFTRTLLFCVLSSPCLNLRHSSCACTRPNDCCINKPSVRALSYITQILLLCNLRLFDRMFNKPRGCPLVNSKPPCAE